MAEPGEEAIVGTVTLRALDGAELSACKGMGGAGLRALTCEGVVGGETKRWDLAGRGPTTPLDTA